MGKKKKKKESQNKASSPVPTADQITSLLPAKLQRTPLTTF